MDYFENGFRLVRIVLTGGPCSGKSSAVVYLKKPLEDMGYHVLVMPETATDLISNGISPVTCGTMDIYEKLQMDVQIAKEKAYAEAAESISGTLTKPVLILYDRGMMDNKAYIEDDLFARYLGELGYTEAECLSWYDAVFHLTTAAKGAEDAYTRSNNQARMETVEEAVAVDDDTLHAWEDHPCRTIIDNSTGFAEKLERLWQGIRLFLEEAEKEEEM